MAPQIFRHRVFSILFVLLGITASALAAEPPIANRAVDKEQRLLRWYQSHTVSAYKKAGYTNPSWDESAENALGIFSRGSANLKSLTATDSTALYLSLSNAVSAGCNDPLIRYLHLLHGPGEPVTTQNEIIEIWVRTADRLQKSEYATPLKFDAEIRPWKLWTEYNQQDPDHPPAHRAEAARCYGEAFKLAVKVPKETNTPIEVVYEVMAEMEHVLAWDKGGLIKFYEAVKNELNKTWPQSAYVALFRGSFFVDYAWQARGSGLANTVSAQGWKLFSERLTTADESLQKAWRLDPTLEAIPLKMISVELGKGRERERMELWFRRAMALNTNNQAACTAKLYYLLPQWHGSAKDMIDFGRECAASNNWGPDVAWTLIRAHERLVGYVSDPGEKKDYWKNPRVWADVKLSCEKYLLASPNGTNDARQACIFQARRCEQWDEVNRQLGLLTSTNYNYFGGRAEFDKMARTAADKTKRTK